MKQLFLILLGFIAHVQVSASELKPFIYCNYNLFENPPIYLGDGDPNEIGYNYPWSDTSSPFVQDQFAINGGRNYLTVWYRDNKLGVALFTEEAQSAPAIAMTISDFKPPAFDLSTLNTPGNRYAAREKLESMKFEFQATSLEGIKLSVTCGFLADYFLNK